MVCDTYSRSGNLDPVAVERVLEDRTAAIIVSHMFGLAAEIEELVALGSQRSSAFTLDEDRIGYQFFALAIDWYPVVMPPLICSLGLRLFLTH